MKINFNQNILIWHYRNLNLYIFYRSTLWFHDFISFQSNFDFIWSLFDFLYHYKLFPYIFESSGQQTAIVWIAFLPLLFSKSKIDTEMELENEKKRLKDIGILFPQPASMTPSQKV